MISINEHSKIAIVGLGYVGLPLALSFAEKFDVTGYDLNQTRIQELKSGLDKTREVSNQDIAEAKAVFTNKIEDIRNADIYIITVPTPVNDAKKPDLSPLINATTMVAGLLQKGNIVIYESTVFPGATEEECLPILEQISSLKINDDFGIGYSPERINPGDHSKRLQDIVKIVSGSDDHIAEQVDKLYSTIIVAGTYRAENIKVAEAAKVIENTQRDLNIALMNELSKIFSIMNIDTKAVLEAAETKWNFASFRPGLVGGHCIGVDPYYLTHKAQMVGYDPEIILAGRRLNDSMPGYVANKFTKALLQKNANLKSSKVLVMGLSFKENCPDTRNSKIIELVDELEEFGITVDVHDPWVDADQAKNQLDIKLLAKPMNNSYDGIIIAVGHSEFNSLGIDTIKEFGKENCIIYDLKGIFSASETTMRL